MGINDRNLKTTIVPRDRSQAFKAGRCKVLTRKKHQPRAVMENPLTVAQLMETMIPKKLNFILPKVTAASTIPKLGGGLLGGAETDSLKGIKGYQASHSQCWKRPTKSALSPFTFLRRRQ